MREENSGTMIVSGPIGIIDAALVRYLEDLKEGAGELLIHVAGSIYKEIIPMSHINEFLCELSVVDGIIDDSTHFERILRRSGGVLATFPTEELRRYSVDRILKKIGIEINKNSRSGPGRTKLAGLNDLVTLYGADPRERKTKFALVSGSFDLIHLGHVRYIKVAKKTADVVVVATMSTSSIKQQQKNIKGDRPIYSREDRVKVLSALRSTDHVALFDELDCKEIIRTLKPDVFLKHEKDMPRQIVKEECELVETLGGKIIVTRDDVAYSSTDIIHHVRGIKR